MAFKAVSPQNIVEDAVAGRLDIPEFQRGFVWQPEKVKNLLDSLCRGYPVGAILAWRSRDYQAARGASGATTDRLWIVDGQQRATAFCLLTGRKPYWFPTPEPWESHYRKCDIKVNLQSDPAEVELTLANPVINQLRHWTSVREILNLGNEGDIPQLAARCLAEMGQSLADTAATSRVMAIISRVQSAFRRAELVQVEIDHDPADVAEIFGRLNSAGTRVNEGDVAIALLAVRQQGWVKQQLLPYLSDLAEQGFDLEPSFLIRAMASIRRGSGRLRDIPRDFWEASNEFNQGWRETTEALRNVLRVLRELGILSLSILPSHNVLIPMLVLDNRFIHGDVSKTRRAFRWMLAATQDGRYSGAAMTTMDQDISAVRAASDFEAAVAALEERLNAMPPFGPPDLLRRYDESDFLRLILYLVAFDNKAEDWKTGQRLGFDRSDNALNDGFRPEWHHFMPRGRLRRRTPPPAEDLVNSLANIVVLSEGDNRRFSYSEPHTYLAQYNVPDHRVLQQFFPSDRGVWTSARFEEFITLRSELLAEAMNNYVARLTVGRASTETQPPPMAVLRQNDASDPPVVNRGLAEPTPAATRPQSRTAFARVQRAARAESGSVTNQNDWRLPILEVLVQFGGSGQAGEILDHVGEKMSDRLTEVDRQELRPGQIRWRISAAWCRKKMVEERLLSENSPNGTWTITESGRVELRRLKPCVD